MQLQAAVDQLDLLVGGPVLGHRGLLDGELLLVEQLDAPVDEDPGQLGLGGELGELEAGVLELADRLAERLAVAAVLDRVVEHALHRGSGDDGDREALLRQVLHQVDEAHALLAEEVGRRDADIVEAELRRVLGVEADLVEVASPLEARHAALDDEQREALGALLRIGAGDDDHQVGVDTVGDERLGAVEDPVVTVAHRAGLDALQVAAGAGLGHRDGRDQLARTEAREPALLLLLVGEFEQVGSDDIVVQHEAQAAEAELGGLLGHDGVVTEVVHATAAVFLRHRHAEKALRAGLLPHLTVDDLVLLPLLVEGGHLLFEELPVRLPEEVVLGLEKGAFHLRSCVRRRSTYSRYAGERVVTLTQASAFCDPDDPMGAEWVA